MIMGAGLPISNPIGKSLFPAWKGCSQAPIDTFNSTVKREREKKQHFVHAVFFP